MRQGHPPTMEHRRSGRVRTGLGRLPRFRERFQEAHRDRGRCSVHVALSLGLAACQSGLAVGFTTAASLVHELIEARDERRLLNLQKRLARLKLLIIDELGFVPLSKTGSERLTGALLDRLTDFTRSGAAALLVVWVPDGNPNRNTRPRRCPFQGSRTSSAAKDVRPGTCHSTSPTWECHNVV